MSVEIIIRAHTDLTPRDLDRLEALFDREYRADFGPWDADYPYGYAPADTHVMALMDGVPVAHIGFQRRVITVGEREVVVAGVGGVLVSADARGTGLGRRVMLHAQTAMRAADGIEFGYLGCRDEVVPFYESAGWHRFRVRETHLARGDATRLVSADNPNVMICAVSRQPAEWPAGSINLRGGAW
ncbi:aminoglycoside 2'-N-acetyltransferase I [Mycetocola sp. BIGb0189]|uniref:GNAT family N-acetyltransferase n=1 Tax=Mycetocola sp. BIGb0189 TaxID=2940604 RepID=UPI0021680836|nr:GNAT family N-acetyltransferase [Mycetocola sp. BIGb0189]MCS4276568.1 aminoglycoside 2'-N-acetyltransferase I [Mycetocola sp. BIGb0189]